MEDAAFRRWLASSSLRPQPGYETGIMAATWAAARREALEEAARIAEEYAATLPFEYVTGKGVAAAIRAKIGEGQGNG